MKRVLLEVAVETPEDAFAAEQGGADRLELCAALDLGGITPSLGTFLEMRNFAKLPTCVMIRPRPGDFVYSPAEVDIMRRDIELYLPHKPAAFVFGVLQSDGRVNLDACGNLVRAADGTPCVFHRAFDRTPDVLEALEELITLRFKRVLTSGQEETALQGVVKLAELVQAAGKKIDILACGRIRAENVAQIVKVSQCGQVHGSFAEPLPLPGGRGHRGYQQRVRTNREAVRQTREVLDSPWELLPG